MINEPLTTEQEPTTAEPMPSVRGEAPSLGTPEAKNSSAEAMPSQELATSLATELEEAAGKGQAPVAASAPLASAAPSAQEDEDEKSTLQVSQASAEPVAEAAAATGSAEPAPPQAEPPAPATATETTTTTETTEAPPGSKKQWYVVKVQSGREDTIREAIERKVRKEGLEAYFGQIKIPVEKVTEVKLDKSGKKVTRTRERRLYAGYIFAEVEYNDRILYLFRETSGVGGFVGEHPGQPERPPTPMSEREIQRILGGAVPGAEDAKPSDVPPPPKGLNVGDHVRVVDGPFNGMDAVVKAIHADQAKVIAEVMIFGRPVNVDFEYYQIEQ